MRRGGGGSRRFLPSSLLPGVGFFCAKLLAGHHKSHSFRIVAVSYIWIHFDIGNFKKERYFGVG